MVVISTHKELGFFPELYPDELLYSACARYADRVHSSYHRSVLEELFGPKASTANIYLPYHLKHFISVLPPGHHYSVEQLINQHTLLPFFAPFIEPQRLIKLKKAMYESPDSNICVLFTSSSIKTPTNFRFCPLCVAGDKKDFGEPYWHRLHQVPGVLVCPVHQILLEESTIPTRFRKNTYSFYSAQASIRDTSPKPINLDNFNHKVLLKLTEEAQWLLQQTDLAIDKNIQSKRYLTCLSEKNFVSCQGKRLYKDKFIETFLNYYSPDLLEQLDCSINPESHHSWLIRLAKSTSPDQHPIRHLLLIHFLGYSVSTFLQLPEQGNFFGDGPWPCLNPVCPHFQKLVINSYTLENRGNLVTGVFSCNCGLTYSHSIWNPPYKRDTGKIKIRIYGSLWEETLRDLWIDPTVANQEISKRLGVCWGTVKRQAARLELAAPRFKQELGSESEVPTQNQPSNQSSRGFCIEKLTNYRNAWLQAIHRNPEVGRTAFKMMHRKVFRWLEKHDLTWLKQHLPLKDMRVKGSQNCDSELLKTYRNKWIEIISENPNVGRSGLKSLYNKIFRWLERYDSTWLNQHMPAPKRARNKDFSNINVESYESYREQWLHAIAENPDIGREALKLQNSQVFRWLKKHDNEWLMQNMPEPKKKPIRVDWSLRDAEIAEIVQKTAEKLRGNQTYPKRITLQTIGTDTRLTNILRDNLSRLPLTQKVLGEVTDTIEEIAIKRLQWWVEHCKSTGLQVTKSGLAKLSGLRDIGLNEKPHLQEILSNAWNSLNTI